MDLTSLIHSFMYSFTHSIMSGNSFIDVIRIDSIKKTAAPQLRVYPMLSGACSSKKTRTRLPWQFVKTSQVTF